MFVQIKCSFCNQPFDFDSSSGILLADCPHCGKQNTVAAPTGEAKNLTLQRDAPNLSGAKACPACKAQVARDAVLCVNCGYNFDTRQKAGGAPRKNLAVLLGIGLGVLVASAAYLFWPEAEVPPPVVVPAAEPAAVEPAPAAPVAAPAAAPAAPDVAVTPVPAATNAPVETNAPAAGEAAPPPGPTPEEIAAQKAAEERAAFEEKKFLAEQNLRLQLDTREPLFTQNELVELRRKNGVVNKGTFTGLSGTGTNRVILIAGPSGEIGVPLADLDPASRRRVDPEFREAFIQHLMSTRTPAAANP